MRDDAYLTTEEVLEYLQVNLRTVYRLIKAGKLPAVRVGRQWRFRKGDLDAWLQRQRPGTGRTAPAAAHPPKAPAARSRILVVDDEENIRDLLAKALARAEYLVEVAAGGAIALDRLRLDRFDLVITDLKMPGTDGLALIRELRRHRADLPIIIITGFPSEASAIEAINLGVSGYVIKPFRIPQILAAVARALGG